jgi:uncharacterized protein (TIGR03067 family)
MRAFIIPTVVMGLIVCGAGRADDKGTAKETKMLEGIWQLTEGVMGGKAFPPEVTKAIKLELSPGKYVVPAEPKDEGTVKYLPNTSPSAMEITGTAGPNKGKTFPAIYELKGDTLTVCYDLSGKARPTEFASKTGTLLFLAKYTRVKP